MAGSCRSVRPHCSGGSVQRCPPTPSAAQQGGRISGFGGYLSSLRVPSATVSNPQDAPESSTGASAVDGGAHRLPRQLPPVSTRLDLCAGLLEVPSGRNRAVVRLRAPAGSGAPPEDRPRHMEEGGSSPLRQAASASLGSTCRRRAPPGAAGRRRPSGLPPPSTLPAQARPGDQAAMTQQWSWVHVVVVASIGTILEWWVSRAAAVTG